MKDIQDAIARTAKHLAEIGQVIVDAIEGMTPGQRAAIEFLAENPKVAEALQELNQKLAKQKATGEAIKEAAKPKEPLITVDDARDAVLSWASTLAIHEVRCKKIEKGVAEVITFEAYKLGSAPRIEFASWSLDADVTDGAIYTIAELCGEEEEE